MNEAQETEVPEAERAPSWGRYTDAELMGRLLRRGVEPVTAKGLVRDREHPSARDEISGVLDREYLDENDEAVTFEIPLERRSRR